MPKRSHNPPEQTDFELVMAPGVEKILGKIDESLRRIAVAAEKLVTILTPKPQPKATRIFSKPEIEEEEVAMVQLYPTQKFKDTFRFNGPVDEQPVITCDNKYVTLTQDPMVTEATPDTADNPAWVDTLVTIHGECNDPTNPDVPIYLQGRVSISVFAKVDVGGTDEVESITKDFGSEFQYLQPSQPKATNVSSTPEIEA